MFPFGSPLGLEVSTIPRYCNIAALGLKCYLSFNKDIRKNSLIPVLSYRKKPINILKYFSMLIYGFAEVHSFSYLIKHLSRCRVYM